ncbi:MAG: transketolase [bacterium]
MPQSLKPGSAARPDTGGPALDELCVNTIRTLSMDAVQRAKSGHPGTPMALAPAAYVLFSRVMRYNPGNPDWFDRDRFILSCGHASMLLYSVLHLCGYDLSLEDLVNFRQWGSKTPGHPEYGMTPGVETTTGPLGQGLMNAVGMAIAEAHLAAVFNREGHGIVDHRTYVFASDGDLLEGASHEAASLAGHLGLGKLIVLYDDNRITIEGSTDLAYSEDVAKRFESYGWHVQNIGDRASDLETLETAFGSAKEEGALPSLSIVRSHIGIGSPNFEDTAAAHGAPLGEEEVELTKKKYGWPEKEKFLVPDDVREHMGRASARGEEAESGWGEKMAAYRNAHPELARRLEAALKGDPPPGWEERIPVFAPEEGPAATRAASGKVLNAIAQDIPWLQGGSADLAGSNNSLISGEADFARGSFEGRNMRWGVREHVMCAASSGMALHGGMRPYAATFFVFTDYARPAIRLAALMKLPVIYLMTHDSIGLGEDGPTHQPVEHLASLRAVPNLSLIRPADANEAAYAWRAAIERREGPTMLVLTRQSLPIFDREKLGSPEGVLKGAYVLSKERGGVPDAILIGTGSEVCLCLDAQEILAREGVDARVVSMPSWDLFRAQPESYRVEVLPPGVKARLAVEAGAAQGWSEWIGDSGGTVCMSGFGASAPAKVAFEKLGFSAENVASRAKKLLGK